MLRIRRGRLRPKYAHGCGGTCGRKAGYCPQKKQVRPDAGDTKSRAGRRTIGLPDPLIALLRAHRQHQDGERQASGQLWHDQGWVFARPDGRPLSPNTDYHEWKSLLAEAGLRDTRLPEELNSHIARLRQSPSAAPYFQEGWRVEIVDLARVCTFQPSVFTDFAAERVEDIKADDIDAIAAVTLPAESPEPPRVQFDRVRQAYMVLSPDLNLRIVGQFGTAVQDTPGATGLGFIVRVMPSFMQVVHFRDRYLLRDGHNRAIGLLGRGITHVPVLTRSMRNIEEIAPPPGMLPQDAYLGRTAPAATRLPRRFRGKRCPPAGPSANDPHRGDRAESRRLIRDDLVA